MKLRSQQSDSSPMVESSSTSSFYDSIRPIADVFRLGSQKPDSASTHPVTKYPTGNGHAEEKQLREKTGKHGVLGNEEAQPAVGAAAATLPPSANLPAAAPDGETSTALDLGKKLNLAMRFYRNAKDALLSNWSNLLLVFVPVGIAAQFANLNPVLVFTMNALAIIPLAGLLAHATEAVACTLGDTIGALLNVTFGNAVELIIFIIALVKDEIRIVQASLVGSILANLLLILGMSFLFGGLRFREQIYNSTVTQMSACLLSLSVTSLLLPTAFHAVFSTDNQSQADAAVLQLSRGSSVILLLVYVLYLLFQLKSHAYMYESTPQHVIDEESRPGVLAEMLNSSSSSDSSSCSDDSEGSSGSHTTAKRIKRALRRRGRRKSSASSKDTPSIPSTLRTPSNISGPVSSAEDGQINQLGVIASGDEADDDDTPAHFGGFGSRIHRRDFGSPNGDLAVPGQRTVKKSKKESKKKRRSRKGTSPEPDDKHAAEERITVPPSPRVTFVQETQCQPNDAPRRQFNIRTLSSVRPTMPKVLSSTVFSTTNPTRTAVAPSIPAVPRAPYGLRRTSSLPDRLNRSQSVPAGHSPLQHATSVDASEDFINTDDNKNKKPHMSRTAAIVLLLIVTGLVALCAEFLVGSINYMVATTNISEVFIGLILLPIVGNAAEHVTAVTVATKNKMDLAIGVAVGSSIQIALFVTPVIVLLGWILGRDMSLLFTLFETMTLFVSAFIVNFLVLDGRSNYLEGSLLMAAYTIIAVAAWFYPDASQQSTSGVAGA